MKILVTNKTDFNVHTGLQLGEVLHFDGFGTYTHPNGEQGIYDQWWLNGMLLSGAFVEVTEDDPLPPVPDSARYYHTGYHGIDADTFLDVHHGHFASGPRIRINDKYNRGITIDADSALQLAHDLRRMAMQIKRDQRERD